MGRILTASTLATPIVYGLDKQRDIESAHKAIKVSNKNIAKLQKELVNEGYFEALDFIYKNDSKKVKDLQRELVSLGYLKGAKEIDGIYGPKTSAAFKKYYLNSLVDGRMGKNTENALYRKVSNSVLTDYNKNAPKVKLTPRQYTPENTSKENAINIALNGISRKFSKYFNNEGIESTRKEVVDTAEKLPEQEDLGNYNYSLGINLPTSGRYSLPVGINNDITLMSNISANLNSLRFGYRNRGDINAINTSHVLLTPFYPFVTKDVLRQEIASGKRSKKGVVPSSYIALSPDGQLKVSTNLDDIPDDYVVTNTYSNKVKGFVTDDSGNVKSVQGKNQGKKHLPLITVYKDGLDANGKPLTKTQPFTSLLMREGKPNEYDAVNGGKVILSAGNDLRLESGSVENIIDAFNNFLNSHPNDTVTIYLLDNGTYNRTLYFPGGNISSELLEAYDGFNTTGGSFGYVIDTVPTLKVFSRGGKLIKRNVI